MNNIDDLETVGYEILSIIPCPDVRYAMYRQDDGSIEKQRVMCFALIKRNADKHYPGYKCIVSMVMDHETGMLEPAHTVSNFEGIEYTGV